MIKCPLPTNLRSLIPSQAWVQNPYSIQRAVTHTTTKPTRIYISHISRHYHRSFHSTPSRHASAERSHYDVLGVSPDISKSDLKKRFYTLSKTTHPDVNRDDPNAAARFAEVSEAYTILGNDEKRHKYDRDVMPRFSRRPSGVGSAASNVRNRSGTYAGSRPATGLSTRRGTFKGPPPSFYQTGSHAAPSAEEQARRDQASYAAGAQAGSFDASQFAAPGQWDPTFNPNPIHKTQTAEDTRRANRRAEEVAAAQAYADAESNFFGRFLVVSMIVAFGVSVGTIVVRMSSSPRGGLLKGDGTRRDAPVYVRS